MSWLARIVLPAESPLTAKAKDDYYWHQKLWLCYPSRPEHKRDFLTRLERKENHLLLWLKGEKKPVCPGWCPPECFSLKEIAPSFLSHRFYAFDLLANPTKTLLPRKSDGSIDRGNEGKRPRGKRLPLKNAHELKTWLNKKAAASGFRLAAPERLEITPPLISEITKKEKSLSLTGTQFRGFLEVIDPSSFAAAYRHGIGTAKGLGFGLLLLAPSPHFDK